MDSNVSTPELQGAKSSINFLEAIIEDDLKNGRCPEGIVTRFPPEPNGYLHIGHAKSICLNFGLAKRYGGKTNLRFDDTNPATEDTEYVEAIMEDVRWLGFDWGDGLFYASDYFGQLYSWAVAMIRAGLAYVDDQPAEVISQQRGVPTAPGTESPYRNRSVEENLSLFERMKDGEFGEGEKVLRAKVDMASPNMHMRDPIMYRILHKHHHRTGDSWCIYPTYDWAHGQSDYLEGITHSVCTLEFEVHRPLYDWFVEQIKEGDYRPRQYEFARLNLSYTVMSKRRLLQLVQNKLVAGWDDPRMPTVCGLRRRGYTPASIRSFAERVGVAKRENQIGLELLEFCIREDLNRIAPRVMAVLDPLKVVITNYPEDLIEEIEAVNNPEDVGAGTRKVPFSKVLYIERDDFMENPPSKYFRLSPGREVRLRYAYFVTCTSLVKDADGKVTEVHCSYDPASRGGNSPDGRKVKATIHWVSAAHAVPCEVRLYDRLFTVASPGDEENWLDYLNPDSLKVLPQCFVEPSVQSARPLDTFQFERMGYFSVDSDSSEGKLVFNRTVSLKDTWAKVKEGN